MDDRLQKGIQVYRSGDRAGAMRIFSDLLRENPRNEPAWLWLSACVDDPHKREFCLKKVLEINPNNRPALDGLAKLHSVVVSPAAAAQTARPAQPAQNASVQTPPPPRRAANQPSAARRSIARPAAAPQKKRSFPLWAVVLLVMVCLLSAAGAAVGGYYYFLPQNPLIAASTLPASQPQPSATLPAPAGAPGNPGLPQSYGAPLLLDGLKPLAPQNAAGIKTLGRWGEGNIRALDWARDGQSIAVGTSIGITLRSGSKLENAQTIAVSGAVQQIAFSPDGRQLAAALESGRVFVWQTGVDAPIFEAQGGGELTFSPDAKKLAVRSKKEVMIYDLSTRQPVTTYLPKSEDVSKVQAWPDGRFVIAEWNKEKLTLVDVSSGESFLTLNQDLKELGNVKLAAISPDGRHLSWVNNFSKIVLYDLNAKQVVWQKDAGSVPEYLWFTDNGNQVWSGNGIGLYFFDLQGNEIGSATGPGRNQPFATSGDGSHLIYASSDINLRIDTPNSQEQYAYSDWPQPLKFLPPVLLRPDGKLVAAPDSAWMSVMGYALDGTIAAVYIGDIQSSSDDASAYAFSPDGQWVALACKQSIRLMSAQDMSPRGYQDLPYPGENFSVRSAQYSQDGQRLAAWGAMLAVWDIGSRQVVQTFDPQQDWVDVVLKPDHTLSRVAVGLREGQVRVAAIDGSGSALQLSGHTQPIAALAFSNDDRLLASVAQGDPLVKVWDAHSGQLLTTLTSNAPRQMIFSAYGKLLFVGQEDGVIQVWEVGSGKLLASLNGHSGAITSLDISLDGSLLVSSGEDATIRFWGFKP